MKILSKTKKLHNFVFTILLSVAFSMPGAKAEYPNRPVKIIINAAGDDAADSTARALANERAKRLGQTFMNQNTDVRYCPGSRSALQLRWPDKREGQA